MQRLVLFLLIAVALTAACAQYSSMGNHYSSMGNHYGSMGNHYSSMGNHYGSMGNHYSSMGHHHYSSMGHHYSSMGHHHYSSMGHHYSSMGYNYPPPNYHPHNNYQYRQTCWDMGYDASNVEMHIDCLEYLMTQQHMFTQYELEVIQEILVQLAGAMNVDIDEVIPSDTVRLVGGRNSTMGRVEVFHAGMWGTVCDDEWDDCDARVVCRMLGYNNGQAFQNACFGEGWGDHFTILLDDVYCSGYEDDLLACPRGEAFGSHNCGHYEDAGVRCWDDDPFTVTPQCNNWYHYDYMLESEYCTWGSMPPYKRDLEATAERRARSAGKK